MGNTSNWNVDIDAGTIDTDQLPAGYSLRVKIENDDTGAWSPFDDDGHGETRTEYSSYGTPKLARGETILHSERGNHWIYNQGAAFVTAWRDGWGLSPDSLAKLTRKLGKKPTRGQIRAEAVRQDMTLLRRYLSGDWWYIGVCVSLYDANGQKIDDQSLWGIDSDSTEYHAEVATELATELMHSAGILPAQRAAKWRAALTEARERKAWAMRDVQTVGA